MRNLAPIPLPIMSVLKRFRPWWTQIIPNFMVIAKVSIMCWTIAYKDVRKSHPKMNNLNNVPKEKVDVSRNIRIEREGYTRRCIKFFWKKRSNDYLNLITTL